MTKAIAGLLIAFVTGSALAADAPPAGDPEAGKARSAACAACHGPDGNSTAPNYPKLAGQHESYLYKQLRDYKQGNRQNAIMAGMVAGLTEKDMRDLAAYYAGQARAPARGDETQVGRGQEIYRGGITATGVPACTGCHSPAGHGNAPAAYPSLSAQPPQYTLDQLAQFKAGARANDSGRMMRNVAAGMTAADMEAVAHYLAALPVAEAP